MRKGRFAMVSMATIALKEKEGKGGQDAGEKREEKKSNSFYGQN